MNLSKEITKMILDMLSDSGTTEIKRNDLAEQLGCVPSQINYVLASRFTPEQGYIVESRRGGGGYIKITRATCTPETLMMHLINSIGDSMDEKTCRLTFKDVGFGEFFPATDFCTEKILKLGGIHGQFNSMS